MRYIELKNKLKDFPIFSLGEIRKFEKDFDRRRLSEWQQKGYIKKIIKEFYIFSDIEINEYVLFLIGNYIYKPSYVSFESALSYYKLIPESIYAVTSMSSRNTYTFKTPLGEFIYRKIKPELMFGYKPISFKDCTFKIATAEKALLDYMYIRPSLKNDGDFEELRLDKGMFFENVEMKKLEKYLSRFKNKSLEKRLRKLVRFMTNV